MFSNETLSEFKAVVILYICAFSIEIDISNSEEHTGKLGDSLLVYKYINEC